MPSEENIIKKLILYSEKILLESLRFYCEKNLASRVTKENAVELYRISKMIEVEDLRKACLAFMGTNMSYFADELAKNLEDSKNLVVKRQEEDSQGESTYFSKLQTFLKKWKY